MCRGYVWNTFFPQSETAFSQLQHRSLSHVRERCCSWENAVSPSTTDNSGLAVLSSQVRQPPRRACGHPSRLWRGATTLLWTPVLLPAAASSNLLAVSAFNCIQQFALRLRNLLSVSAFNSRDRDHETRDDERPLPRDRPPRISTYYEAQIHSSKSCGEETDVEKINRKKEDACCFEKIRREKSRDGEPENVDFAQETTRPEKNRAQETRSEGGRCSTQETRPKGEKEATPHGEKSQAPHGGTVLRNGPQRGRPPPPKISKKALWAAAKKAQELHEEFEQFHLRAGV